MPKPRKQHHKTYPGLDRDKKLEFRKRLSRIVHTLSADLDLEQHGQVFCSYPSHTPDADLEAAAFAIDRLVSQRGRTRT